MKVDIHTHILPPELPKFKERFGYGGFIHLEKKDACTARMLKDDGTFFRDVKSNLWDSKTRLEECDADHVDLQVLSTVPVMFSYWAKPKDGLEVAKFLNDHIAQVVTAHPKRFVGLASVPLQDAELAIGELERCVKKLGLSGAQIGTHVNGTNLDDVRLFPFFQAAEKLNASLFVHPWDMLAPERMKKYWLPWLVGMPAELGVAMSSLVFSGVLEKLPRLRIAFAHGGGSFPALLGRLEQGFHARPDLCAVDNAKNPREYVKRLYVDSLVHDPRALQYLLDTFGASQVALGSDYPFPLGEERPGRLIKSMKLDAAVEARLLSGTALEWLGRKVQ